MTALCPLGYQRTEMGAQRGECWEEWVSGGITILDPGRARICRDLLGTHICFVLSHLLFFPVLKQRLTMQWGDGIIMCEEACVFCQSNKTGKNDSEAWDKSLKGWPCSRLWGRVEKRALRLSCPTHQSRGVEGTKTMTEKQARLLGWCFQELWHVKGNDSDKS